MGMRLKDNLNAQYFMAANKLRPKNASTKIVAYVESYDDVFFWRTVLSTVETDDVKFEVMLPSRSSHLDRGKRAALMRLMEGKTGEHLIACVDADYDYLLNGTHPTSRFMHDNPWVFHTYAYAIENMQCYAPSLHKVAVAATLNDKRFFDYTRYLADFSEIIYPLFVWNIMLAIHPSNYPFTITDFLKTIDMKACFPGKMARELEHLRKKVDLKMQQLQQLHPHAENALNATDVMIRQLGVQPNETYMYIQGHHLFNKVVTPLLTRVCDLLMRDREREITVQSVHQTQRRNELLSYQHSTTNIETMLRRNTGFLTSPQCARLQADLRQFVENLSVGH